MTMNYDVLTFFVFLFQNRVILSTRLFDPKFVMKNGVLVIVIKIGIIIKKLQPSNKLNLTLLLIISGGSICVN